MGVRWQERSGKFSASLHPQRVAVRRPSCSSAGGRRTATLREASRERSRTPLPTPPSRVRRTPPPQGRRRDAPSVAHSRRPARGGPRPCVRARPQPSDVRPSIRSGCHSSPDERSCARVGGERRGNIAGMATHRSLREIALERTFSLYFTHFAALPGPAAAGHRDRRGDLPGRAVGHPRDARPRRRSADAAGGDGRPWTAARGLGSRRDRRRPDLRAARAGSPRPPRRQHGAAGGAAAGAVAAGDGEPARRRASAWPAWSAWPWPPA